jgi:chorismate-pyruvate lyase
VRAYRVDVAGVPVMAITEWFLPALRPFEGKWHENVDLNRRP